MNSFRGGKNYRNTSIINDSFVMYIKLFLIVNLFLFQLPAIAATISGVVHDEGEAVVASVKLINAENSVVVKSVRSDNLGNYQITAIKGRYKIGAFANNFSTVWIKDIVLEEKDLEIDIQMTPTAFVDDEAVPDSDECD